MEDNILEFPETYDIALDEPVYELLIKSNELSEAALYAVTTLNALSSFIIALLFVTLIALVWGRQ